MDEYSQYKNTYGQSMQNFGNERLTSNNDRISSVDNSVNMQTRTSGDLSQGKFSGYSPPQHQENNHKIGDTDDSFQEQTEIIENQIINAIVQIEEGEVGEMLQEYI